MDAWTSVSTLPNPFEFMDRSMVMSPEDWQKRREELSSLAERFVFGRVLKPESLSYEVELMADLSTKDPSGCEKPSVISDSNRVPAHSYRLVVTMKQGHRQADFGATVHIPRFGVDTMIEGPYPVLIVVGSVTEAQRRELLKNGYAVINMPPNPIYSDDAARSGVYTTLFPYQAGEVDFDSGALMAWAWGVSRVVDALDIGAFADINPAQTMVTGVSRYGKAALLAGAFDERIAITIPVDTGQAGTSSFRYNVEGRIYHYTGNPFPDGMGRSEKISNMVGSLSHWFSSQILQFTNREESLPFDSHCIMSLVAPRPLLVFAGEEFDWLCQPSTVLSYTAAKEVYEFLEASEAIALNVRKGAHAIQDHDIAIILDFANPVFRKRDRQLCKERFPHVDTYNEFPYVPDSSYIRWSRPGKHVLWTETEQIIAGIPNTIVAYSDADTVTLKPPSNWLSSTLPITVPVEEGRAVFHLAAQQATEGRYVLTARGANASHAVGFLGISQDMAFKATFTGDGTSWMIHFVDRYDKEAVRVFVGGRDITNAEDKGRFHEASSGHVYLMNYGISITNVQDLRPDERGAYHIEVKHLRFDNIYPEKTFQYSYTTHEPNGDSPQKHQILFKSGADTGFTMDD